MTVTQIKKTYISANQLLEDSFALALDILESGYRPTFIVGVWRGGAPIGIAVQEVLDVCGVKANHIAVRTSSYRGIDQREKQVQVYGLGYLVDTVTADDNLLIVDDVHDSGLSVTELIDQVRQRCGSNAPSAIKIATVYYKPGQSQVKTIPDYYVHTTEDWLVFPHELAGLTVDELADHKPGIASIKKKLMQYRSS